MRDFRDDSGCHEDLMKIGWFVKVVNNVGFAEEIFVGGEMLEYKDD